MNEALDGLPYEIHPKYKNSQKRKYDMLLLTSDGVHDILSDSYMEEVIKNYIHFQAV